MKKKSEKKLKLRRETLRVLEKADPTPVAKAVAT